MKIINLACCLVEFSVLVLFINHKTLLVYSFIDINHIKPQY